MHRVDNFMPGVVLKKTFTDGPTSGSWNKLIMGASGLLEVLPVLQDYTQSTRSISGFCTAAARTPSISAFDTAGAALLGVLYCS